MDERLTALGTRLRKLRLENDMSIRALSERAGLDKNQILRVERGEADPKYTTLYRIAEALGVSVGDLLDASNTLDGRKKE